MIRVEKIEKDGKEGRDCSIIGYGTEIEGDLIALFSALSRNMRTELVLLKCIDGFLTSRATEIINEKENK